jgi:hypothetical protein
MKAPNGGGRANRLSDHLKQSVGAILTKSILGLAFYGLLVFCYTVIISPDYSYAGMYTRVLPLWCWLFSIACTLLAVNALPATFARPSDFASWFLCISTIIPVTIIPFLLSMEAEERLVPFVLAFLSSFWLFEWVRRRKSHVLAMNLRMHPNMPIGVLAITLIIFSGIAFWLGGFKINLSFEDEYVRRMLSRDVLPERSPFNYMVQSLHSVFVPLGIALGAITRKTWLLVIGGLGAIAVFSLSGAKFVMFAPAVMFLVVLISSKLESARVGPAFLAMFVALVALAILEFVSFDSHILSTIVVRRQFVLTSQIGYYYWDYYLQHPFVYFGDSTISYILTGYQTTGIPSVIGLAYYGKGTTNANANMWANSFAEFGYFGMLGCSVVAASFLRFADMVGKRCQESLASAVCVIMGMIWTNSALQTSLMNDGILFLFLFLFAISSTPLVQTAPSHQLDLPHASRKRALPWRRAGL